MDYVLEGSVRWEKPKHGGARVRVTPQLVSTADGTHLWAEVYDEPLDGIFRVQSDIAQKVVQALNVTLLDPQQGAVQAVPTRNLEAYDFYLRGRDYNRRGSDENTLRAGARMYEKAVELDPAFALAYARLSALYSRMYWSYFDHSKQRLGQAKASVDRALQLEPGLPAAHQSASLQAREVEREDQREKRLEQTEQGMVIDMPRPGLRYRPQSAGIAEGEALGSGSDFITALRRAGNRIEPIKGAPVPIAARDP